MLCRLLPYGLILCDWIGKSVLLRGIPLQVKLTSQIFHYCKFNDRKDFRVQLLPFYKSGHIHTYIRSSGSFTCV